MNPFHVKVAFTFSLRTDMEQYEVGPMGPYLKKNLVWPDLLNVGQIGPPLASFSTFQKGLQDYPKSVALLPEAMLGSDSSMFLPDLFIYRN